MYAQLHDTPTYAKPRGRSRAHLRERALPRALGQVWPSAGGDCSGLHASKTASRKKFLFDRRVSRVRCARAVAEPREFAIVVIIIVSGQTVNRFAYVMNNPLSYTDPSGYFSLRKFFRTVLAIAAVVVLGPAGYAPLFSSGLANAAFAGFVSGAISTGTLKGALQGAFSGALFYGVGEMTSLGGAGSPGRILGHAVAGCISSVAGGGSCGSGALAAGFAETVGPHLKFDSVAANVIARAVVGGVGSVLGGGKFENGAITGAFGYLFNEVAHTKMADQAGYGAGPEGHVYYQWTEVASNCSSGGCEKALELFPKYAAPGYNLSPSEFTDGGKQMVFVAPLITSLVNAQLPADNHWIPIGLVTQHAIGGGSIMNVTVNGAHLACCGSVVRTPMIVNDRLYIFTYGVGSNLPGLANVNSIAGPKTFRALDIELRQASKRR